MEYSIKWVEVKTSSTGKQYKQAELEGEGKVSVWPDYKDYENVQAGRSVNGVIRVKGQYKNLVSELEKPQFIRKADDIAKAQENKATQIAAAQDRSAWMWAKNNATLLIANNDDLKNRENLIGLVGELATDIYNLEPHKPF